VLELTAGQPAAALTALAELERRTIDADGGRLKLEWGVLTDPNRNIEKIFWWDDDQLLGFVGIYAFGPPTVELAGTVDPTARRRGIGTALLDAAIPICRQRGYVRALLVTPRESTAGRAFALRQGASLDHSEHALVLLGEPVDGPSDGRVSLRVATPADAADITRLLAAAFGNDGSQELELTATDAQRTLLISFEGVAVGTVRITFHDKVGGVYGFAVDPAWQGRGIGRDVLRRICRQLREQGAERVGLEVEVDNEHALGLYTSIGFIRVTTEDYYALALT
jgi:ribosomal protein S18 acetylase RimI-like enzyme